LDKVTKEAGMALEIELKTRIDEPETVKKRLEGLGIYDCAYEKADVYWFFAGKGAEIPAGPGKKTENSAIPGLSPPDLRVRKETKTPNGGGTVTFTRITYKNRDLRGGVEINDEREFEVSCAGVFEDLLRRLGLAPGIQKHKRGWAWRCGEVLAELSEVRGLGWYLELEILAPPGDERVLAEGQERLFALLEALEIPRNRIETRPYTEMLKALGQIRGGEKSP
jgi:adenylate cyclase class 2